MDQEISAQQHQQRMIRKLHGENNADNNLRASGAREVRLADYDGPQALSKPREIKIVPLDKGYIVTVGCQMIAIPDTLTLIEKLNRYLHDPVTSEHLYNQGKFL